MQQQHISPVGMPGLVPLSFAGMQVGTVLPGRPVPVACRCG